MKRLPAYAVAAAVTSLLCISVIMADTARRHAQKEKTCSGITVEYSDDEEMRFVSEKDIREYISREYGNCKGKRLEDIELPKIEKIISSKSAVRQSDAYLTSDGMIHILVSQREPVLRMVIGGMNWYADSEGFIFPINRNYTPMVPVADGAIPIELSKGFKGKAPTPKGRKWMEEILSVIDFTANDGKWRDSISQIRTDKDRGLIIVPTKGRERFVIGDAVGIGEKFDKIEDYYRYIVPLKKNYTVVDVSFRGQIVCANKSYRYGQ